MAFQGFGEIAEMLRRSTVEVRGGKRGQGSGIIVESERVSVTNAHVVRDARVSVRLWEGSTFPAHLESR